MIYTPPHNSTLNRSLQRKSIFLAGTIDMGNSTNWQDLMADFFEKENH